MIFGAPPESPLPGLDLPVLAERFLSAAGGASASALLARASLASRRSSCCIVFRVRAASLAFIFATYSASASLAKLRPILSPCVHRPSDGANCRLSSGIEYPLGFFQLETQGGTFQSDWSFCEGGRGGELRTGTGNLMGRSNGSVEVSDSLMIHSAAPELDDVDSGAGTYLMKAGRTRLGGRMSAPSRSVARRPRGTFPRRLSSLR
ncbi:hypothetical protein ZWY2020_006242 [Hordeum vulgare]|nr:hypothetical protein ZWY2020_006242 [Hordeum vulgare]